MSDQDIEEAAARAAMAARSSVRARPLALSAERIAEFDADRTGLLAWISTHFVQGADFGKATSHGGAKDTLLKPGAEKLCLLFGWTPRLRDDSEVRAMLGNPPSLIAFYCELVNEHGQLVAEGRGACDLNEKPPRAINSAIKIAEKRAVVDAVLRACGLSELFTQDLEDMGLAGSDEQTDGRVYGGSGTGARAQVQIPNAGQRRADLLEEIAALQYQMKLKDEQIQLAISRDFAPASGGKQRKLGDLNVDELEVLCDKMAAAAVVRAGGQS